MLSPVSVLPFPHCHLFQLFLSYVATWGHLRARIVMIEMHDNDCFVFRNQWKRPPGQRPCACHPRARGPTKESKQRQEPSLIGSSVWDYSSHERVTRALISCNSAGSMPFPAANCTSASTKASPSKSWSSVGVIFGAKNSLKTVHNNEGRVFAVPVEQVSCHVLEAGYLRTPRVICGR